MRAAIMQPYFMPYIGYFQLIANADVFVVYDNIKYTKKGWINRNRRLQNGIDVMFSLPLRKASDSLDVVQRELSADFDRDALLNQFRGSYARAPQFGAAFPLIERIVRREDANLFGFVINSIIQICAVLGIDTPILKSSSLGVDHGLKAQDKVVAICHALGAETYVNPVGGLELYDRDDFAKQGISLQFLRSLPFEYPQFGSPFVPYLSIVDVLMFNPLDDIRERIVTGFELI
jgi:WbqC-like protein family